MGRKTRSPIFRVRFRGADGNRSVLVSRKTKGNLEGARILRVSKVSEEERLKVGEFFPAERLMKELREEARKRPPQRQEVHPDYLTT